MNVQPGLAPLLGSPSIRSVARRVGPRHASSLCHTSGGKSGLPVPFCRWCGRGWFFAVKHVQWRANEPPSTMRPVLIVISAIVACLCTRTAAHACSLVHLSPHGSGGASDAAMGSLAQRGRGEGVVPSHSLQHCSAGSLLSVPPGTTDSPSDVPLPC